MVMQQERERQKRNLINEYNRLNFLKKVGQNAYNNARSLYENRHNLTLGKPVQPNALTSNASTNTIANYASPNMSATPTITNPATANLATEFGGAATPTLSNATTGTTLANFGTQGATALNGGALASSSPLTTAIASEASGAGLGSAGAGLGALGTEAATTAGAGTLAGAGTATAGTGAAMGGAGAAGAAGAGAGTAALGALGPIGAILAGGALIYNMINGAKKKKEQEAMEIDQKAMQQNEQIAQQGTNEAMQNLANDAQQNRQNANQGYVGQLPDIGNEALKQGLVQDVVNQAPETYSPQGTITGGASPIDNTGSTVNTEGLTSGIMNTPKESLANGLIEQIAGVGRGNDMLSDTPNATYNQVNPLYIDEYDGLSNTDLAMKAQNIYDEAINRIEPKHSASQTGINVEPLIVENSNNIVDNLSSNEAKDALKGNLMQNVKSGLNNFISGYKDNAEHGFLEGDLANGIKQNNGLGYRIGEVLGTGSRLMQNPYLQGAIAGIAYGKDKGDALYGLGKGWEWAQNRAKNNAYVDALRKAGLNIPNSVLGGIGATDAAALIKAQQAPYQNKYYNARSRSENVKAGFLPNGKPVKVSDVINAVRTPDDYKAGVDNGTIDPNEIVNTGVTQIYNTQGQVNNKATQLENAANGIPTEYSYNRHESFKHDPDSVKASENYLEGAKIKANAAKNGGKNGGNNPKQPTNNQPNTVKPITNNDREDGIVRKLKNKVKSLANKKAYVTPSGVNYRIV